MLLQFLDTIFLLILLPLLFLKTKTKPFYNSILKSYSLVGLFFALFTNRNLRLQWLSDILQASPSPHTSSATPTPQAKPSQATPLWSNTSSRLTFTTIVYYNEIIVALTCCLEVYYSG